MAVDVRNREFKHRDLLRDTRPTYQKIMGWASKPTQSASVFLCFAGSYYIFDFAVYIADIIFLFAWLFFYYLDKVVDKTLPAKMPKGAPFHDVNNEGPGRDGIADGIMYLGNQKHTDEEIWFTNSDARTHILYLGTTGSGKTEGLKSISSNALAWGSGFIYTDGKADTDLWSSLSSLVRRFGRDDDLLVLNYMTANSDIKAPSNTMNPFATGSASFLTNLLTSLMPSAEGDNVMWKERAVALVAVLMPALTYMRDYQQIPLTVSRVRVYLLLNKIIELSRNQTLPDHIREGVRGYLDTLPGYVDEAFDDNGKPKPPGPDQPMANTEVPFQQHGYLSMQLTRSLQSLGDEYGYIFDDQFADVDMTDVVLNRRILVVLIPALEKSDDEVGNLGKIVAATIKGMMGATLGAEVEGDQAKVIDNKPSVSNTPFITIFDEVGYYIAEGMAVMAAQARSLGFCLVFAAQDLHAMEKKVKEEAKSITANCNINLFGKLEDPGETRQYFLDTVGEGYFHEVSGFQRTSYSYQDTKEAKIEKRYRATYDSLKDQKEGEATMAYQGNKIHDVRIFYLGIPHAKAMRVTRYIDISTVDEGIMKHKDNIRNIRDKLVKKNWTAESENAVTEPSEEIMALLKGLQKAKGMTQDVVEQGIAAVGSVFALSNPIEVPDKPAEAQGAAGGGQQPTAPAAPAATQSPIHQAPIPQAPASPVSQATQAPAAPPAAQQQGAGGPMSFFGSGDSPPSTAAAPAETPPAAPVAATPQVATTPAAASPETADKPASYKDMAGDTPKLDDTVRDTIASAANDVRKSIFKNTEKQDDKDDIVTAAE